MQISAHYVVVKRFIEPKKEGEFNEVEVGDNFVYKGQVHLLPSVPVFVSDHRLGVGQVIMFAKYSPDTFEMDVDGEKMKFVKQTDILAVIE